MVMERFDPIGVKCIVDRRREVSDILAIASLCGKSAYYVYMVLGSRGDQVAKEWWSKLEPSAKCVLETRWRNKTLRETARECGVSVNTVRRIIKRFGDPYIDAYWYDAAVEDEVIEPYLDEEW